MLERQRNIQRLVIPFDGGLDEISAVTALELSDHMEMDNWRLSEDGTRLMKRLGTEDQGGTRSGVDVFGYKTYYDSDGNFCQLIVFEDDIWRKVASGSWTKIHDFSSNITHPQKIIEAQGKQFIINETDSRFVHTDKTDYQIGIDAPTTPMEIRIEYEDADLESEGCDDTLANNGWSETNVGSGDSAYVANFDGSDCFRMRGSTNGGTTNDQTTIDKTYSGGTAGNRIYVTMRLYFDALVGIGDDRLRFFVTPDATHSILLQFNDDQMYVCGILRDSSIGRVPIEIEDDKWYVIQMYCDMEDDTIELWITPEGGTRAYYGTFAMSTTTGATPGAMQFTLDGDEGDTDVYLDYLYISNSTDSTTAGSRYRYAVKYARSGNWGNESNALKSKIYDPYFVGTSQDDLTVDSDSEYTGDIGRVIVVNIDSTGTPDTVSISYDAGDNFYTTYLPISETMHLNYGVTINFAATTGHSGSPFDFWIIRCRPQVVRKSSDETVTISAIPTSSDAQVAQRKIYRSTAGGASFYWMTTLGDNTATQYYSERTPDAVLGALMTEDHDILPSGAGKYFEWWDERMWVFDHDDNIVYYSKQKYPESYDEDNYYITIGKGDTSSDGTGLKAYKDALYVFKEDSIWVIQRQPSGYGRYLVMSGLGCIAGNSIVDANNLLMFLSHRGIELFNGVDVYSTSFSLPMKRTIDKATSASLDSITAVQDKKYNEVLFSIPYNSDSNAKYIVVYNYAKNKWYRFTTAKSVTAMSLTKDSDKDIQVYMGTSDGYVGKFNSTYEDFSSDITATARKGWIDFGVDVIMNSMFIEYESVTDKDATVNCYIDFDKDVARTATLSGSTPSATDRELRCPIKSARIEIGGLRCQYFNFEVINSDDTAGDIKLHKAVIYYAPRIVKGTKDGD